MPGKIKWKTILSSLLLLSKINIAQNFNYQITTSTGSYVELNNTDTISPKTFIWSDDPSTLPIGWTFDYAGSSFETLKVRNNGLLTFDANSQYNFIFLNKDFQCEADSMNLPLSHIKYKTDIVSDKKILKIEYSNVILERAAEKIHFNFQVWLYEEANKIEFHMGTIEGTIPEESSMIGLINMNNTRTEATGYLLQGSTTEPYGANIPAKGNLVELNNIPAPGTIYTFTAN